MSNLTKVTFPNGITLDLDLTDLVDFHNDSVDYSKVWIAVDRSGYVFWSLVEPYNEGYDGEWETQDGNFGQITCLDDDVESWDEMKVLVTRHGNPQAKEYTPTNVASYSDLYAGMILGANSNFFNLDGTHYDDMNGKPPKIEYVVKVLRVHDFGNHLHGKFLAEIIAVSDDFRGTNDIKLELGVNHHFGFTLDNITDKNQDHDFWFVMEQVK